MYFYFKGKQQKETMILKVIFFSYRFEHQPYDPVVECLGGNDAR
jgi:hypothetical protein